MAHDRQQQEVDANFDAFEKMFADLYREHPGKFALMKDQKTVEFFDTSADAFRAGRKLCQRRAFVLGAENSTSRLIVGLGVLSHALSHGRPSLKNQLLVEAWVDATLDFWRMRAFHCVGEPTSAFAV